MSQSEETPNEEASTPGNEVDQLKAKNADLSKQLEDMSRSVVRSILLSENENEIPAFPFFSEVAVASCVKESLVELERRNADLQAELTTLQSLLNESVQVGGSLD